MTAPMTEARRLRDLFEAQGAEPFETGILQPADVLLDLYGEDIRARAYVTADPLRGEMMLRPDFTVPVVRAHMDSGQSAGRYCYAGKIFRKQEEDPARPVEYLQAGFELFDDGDAAEADAEAFTTVAKALNGVPVVPVMGDIGIILAAVRALDTTDARKTALTRHIWRPHRFRALLERYASGTLPAGREALLAQADPLAGVDTLPGCRTHAEIAQRIATLREDAAAPPLARAEVDLIETLLTLTNRAPAVLSILRDMAVDLPALDPAVAALDSRLDALSVRGVNVDDLRFELSMGRSSMEYYDGMVFAFHAPDRPDLPPVATGGRYDTLTGVLGGRRLPAVGAVVRPDAVLSLRSQTC